MSLPESLGNASHVWPDIAVVTLAEMALRSEGEKSTE